MAFSDFTISDLQTRFGISVSDVPDLHGGVPEVPVPAMVTAVMRSYYPLAALIATEKAKSELVVAPMLAEVRELLGQRVSLFSGNDFTIDRDRGLSGACDFLLSRSPLQFAIQAPVAVIVEAKNDSIASGFGQCGAEMLAARIFNERVGNNVPVIHGCVTNGTGWRFLTLEGDRLTLDRTLYTLPEQVAKVFGILVAAARGPE